MTTQDLCELATVQALATTFSDFIVDPVLKGHFRNEARKFILGEFGNEGIPLIDDDWIGEEIEDVTITKLAIFWLEANGLVNARKANL